MAHVQLTTQKVTLSLNRVSSNELHDWQAVFFLGDNTQVYLTEDELRQLHDQAGQILQNIDAHRYLTTQLARSSGNQED